MCHHLSIEAAGRTLHDARQIDISFEIFVLIVAGFLYSSSSAKFLPSANFLFIFKSSFLFPKYRIQKFQLICGLLTFKNDPTTNLLALHFPDISRRVFIGTISYINNPHDEHFIEILLFISRFESIKNAFVFVYEDFPEYYIDN